MRDKHLGEHHKSFPKINISSCSHSPRSMLQNNIIKGFNTRPNRERFMSKIFQMVFRVEEPCFKKEKPMFIIIGKVLCQL